MTEFKKEEMTKVKKEDKEKSRKDKEFGVVYDFISQHLNFIHTVTLFAAILVALPILTFFMTLHSLFDGNTQNAGRASGLMAIFIILVFILIIKTFSKEKAKTD